jgi:hypothetical protein
LTTGAVRHAPRRDFDFLLAGKLHDGDKFMRIAWTRHFAGLISVQTSKINGIRIEIG